MTAEAVPLHDLILKGTHNSLSCRGIDPPWMNHPPEKQIDDFGVWHIEFDYSVERRGGSHVAVVGHNWQNHSTCWGRDLGEQIERIVECRSFAYRPVFVCFDIKAWRRRWYSPWRRAADWALGYNEKWQTGVETLREASKGRLVLLEDAIRDKGGEWPTVRELAGTIVLYEPNKRNDEGQLVGLRATHADGCVTARDVETAIVEGCRLHPDGAECDEGARAFRIDQYQADWTFDYGVPPNPIVVDEDASGPWRVDDAEGLSWRCGSETSHGQVVGEHGTWRFPYRRLEDALERARGVTPVTNGEADPRRAGHGWTILHTHDGRTEALRGH